MKYDKNYNYYEIMGSNEILRCHKFNKQISMTHNKTWIHMPYEKWVNLKLAWMTIGMAKRKLKEI